MIELSLGMVNDISYVMGAEDKGIHQEFKDKYNITIAELQDIVDDYTDASYVDNHIYHIVPIVSVAVVMMNLFMLYML